MPSSLRLRDALRELVPPWLSDRPGDPSAISKPKITSIVPASGPQTGGTALTITGEDFRAGAIVRINGVLCTSIVVVSSISITCVTPAGTVGAQPLAVVNVDSGSDTMGGGFTYTAAASGPRYLQEDGFGLLAEDGSNLVQE
jgi:hypothetical protein